jgi:transcriptional regulator with XRE-family HTH domain
VTKRWDEQRQAYAGNLARNLRRLANLHGNISELCRDIDINRQQFNKYLSGTSLPTSQNMRKICTFFGVTEELLLSASPAGLEASIKTATGSDKSTLDRMIAELATELTAQAPRSFKPGYYFAYYPMMADPQRLTRVLIVTWREGHQIFFKRFTRVREPGVKTKYYPRGRHFGIVTQRNDVIFLLGFNRVGYQDINLMTFNALINNSSHMRTGLALIMSPWGPLATRVTLEYIGSKANARDVLRKCQVLAIDSPEIDPLIRKSMGAYSSWPTPQLEPYGHLEDWGPPGLIEQVAPYKKRSG